MKISVAQVRPVKGDIKTNIENHKKLISLAVARGAGMIFFPELSITGYEPELAGSLAIHQDDPRFDDFQVLSDTKQISIGVGAPTCSNGGICISMIIFQPGKPRQTYSKQYLHSSEEGYFISGHDGPGFIDNKPGIAIAICYELSVPEHVESASRHGAKIYIASAVESINSVEKSRQRLATIAQQYNMTVLFANCIGLTGVYDCPGRSSTWNNKGELLGQLDDRREGILLLDTETQEVITEQPDLSMEKILQ